MTKTLLDPISVDYYARHFNHLAPVDQGNVYLYVTEAPTWEDGLPKEYLNNGFDQSSADLQWFKDRFF
jgi:hypothetical protein